MNSPAKVKPLATQLDYGLEYQYTRISGYVLIAVEVSVGS